MMINHAADDVLAFPLQSVHQLCSLQTPNGCHAMMLNRSTVDSVENPSTIPHQLGRRICRSTDFDVNDVTSLLLPPSLSFSLSLSLPRLNNIEIKLNSFEFPVVLN